MSITAKFLPFSSRTAGSARGVMLRGGVGLCLILATAACGNPNLRKELGLVGQGPDEFTVVKRKPLSIPEGGAIGAPLPPPQPGAPNLVDPRPVEEAQATLAGEVMGEAAAPSNAESAFIAAAGASSADDEIRAVTQKESKRDLRVLDSLLGRADERIETLDPADEARRLAREAKATKNPDLEIPAPPED